MRLSGLRCYYITHEFKLSRRIGICIEHVDHDWTCVYRSSIVLEAPIWSDLYSEKYAHLVEIQFSVRTGFIVCDPK